MALTKEETREIYGESDPKKMSFFNKIKMLFLHPAQFFQGVKAEGLKPAFTMFIAVFVIGSVVSQIAHSVFLAASPFLLLITLIVGPLTTLLFFLWVHLFVKLLGGRNGWKQTLKALLYVYVPVGIVSTIISVILAATLGTILPGSLALLNPLSLVSFGALFIILLIIIIWALYLSGLGLGRLHGISTLRGVGAILVAAIALLVIVLILAVIFGLLFAALLLSSAATT